MIKLYEEYRDNLPKEELNKVKFGNQTQDLQRLADDKNDPILKFFLENGYADKIIREAPTNSSDITKNDLQTLVSMMNAASPEDITFARQAEEDRAQIFLDFFKSKRIEETMGKYKEIDNQSEPLLFYLKDKINRPRPHQLAYYYEIPLYPLIHTDANSASYPGGHAMSTFLLGEYYSRKYPMYRGELQLLANKIAESRNKMGIHYPSDTEIARKIVQLIWKHNLIKN